MKVQRKTKQHNKRKQTLLLSASNQKGYTSAEQLFKESWERRKKEIKKNPQFQSPQQQKQIVEPALRYHLQLLPIQQGTSSFVSLSSLLCLAHHLFLPLAAAEHIFSPFSKRS